MRSFIRHGCAGGLVAILAVGCAPDATEELTRVAIHGVREGEALELDDEGSVSLDNGAEVYLALVRIGRVTLRSDDDIVESDTPVNVDLFERTIVFDESLAGEQLDTVSLTFPEPEEDGVTPGESLSVYVAGLIDDVPFEYRDRSMESIDLLVAAPIEPSSRVVDVHFDLKGWFEGVEERELVPTGAVILIDDSHNATAARVIEAAIRASLGVFPDELLDDDPS